MYADLLHNLQSNPPQPPAVDVGHPGTLVPSRARYPQINYWTLKDWTSYKACVKQADVIASDDDVMAFDFIESMDGIPVSIERINAIRRGARELFVSIQMQWENNGRRAPGTWGTMSHGNKEFYRQKMKEQFPELAFCEGDWKCEQIGTQTYSGWYRTHGKPKQEPAGKRPSKRMASSSKSPTPVPDSTAGRSLPTPVNTFVSVPISDSHQNPHHLSPTSATPGSVLSPVTPVLDLGLNSLDLDSPAAHEVNPHGALEVLEHSNSTQSPTPFSESISPPIPTNTPLSTILSPDANRSPDTNLPPDVPVVVVTPNTPIVPAEHEAIPGASNQVCLFLSVSFYSPLKAPFGI